jgi:hypothetical protein
VASSNVLVFEVERNPSFTAVYTPQDTTQTYPLLMIRTHPNPSMQH